MRAASQALKKVIEIVDQGEAGRFVSMPLENASLALRMSAESLRLMGERGQRLGISVKDSRVVVRLLAGPTESKDAYQFLYGLMQSVFDDQARLFLEELETPPILLKEIPALEETTEVIREGKCSLPPEELKVLGIHLLLRWAALRDREGLFPPANVLSSLSY